LHCIRTICINWSLYIEQLELRNLHQLGTGINGSLLGNWEQLRPQSGCLAFGQLASTGPYYYWQPVANEAAVLHSGNWHQWITFIGQAPGSNYDREAAALHSGNWHQWITFIGQLGNTVESRSGCLAFFG
jgi:hypothetical protein